MEEKNLSVIKNNTELAIQELSIEQIIERKDKIQIVQKKIMKSNVHYGIIPGTDKPTLYKAGAEVIATTFMLSCISNPEDVITKELPNGHREYTVHTKVIHYPTGMLVGTGFGSCSTMESKYRYRNSYNEINTGNLVPGEYWELKKQNKFDDMQKLIGGKGYKVRKIEDSWMIVKIENQGKIENPDIADCYNTVLKMAIKRSNVAAIISATGCSDAYNQDLDDLPPDTINKKKSKTVTPSNLEKDNDSEINQKNIYSFINLIKDDITKAEIVKRYKANLKNENVVNSIVFEIQDILNAQNKENDNDDFNKAAEEGFNEGKADYAQLFKNIKNDITFTLKDQNNKDFDFTPYLIETIKDILNHAEIHEEGYNAINALDNTAEENIKAQKLLSALSMHSVVRNYMLDENTKLLSSIWAALENENHEQIISMIRTCIPLIIPQKKARK